MALQAEHQAIAGDVLVAEDFWGGYRVDGGQQFSSEPGRIFEVIYQQANAHGQKVQTAGSNMFRHRLRGRIQLGLTAPIITATAKGDASQQPHPWASAHTITCR